LQPAPNLHRQEEFSLISDSEVAASVTSPPLPPVPYTISNTTTIPYPPYAQTTPLPGYSPHLPPIDRTKRGQSFYEDLLAKQVIQDLDDERWTCWCHVAKRDQIPAPPVLGLSHQRKSASRVQRYISICWFNHAAKCDFYKVGLSCIVLLISLILPQNPWATNRNGTNGRLYPHFPLPPPPAIQESTERTQEGSRGNSSKFKR
jgi:hypothetical protein